MKIIGIPYIPWNKEPFDYSNEISEQVRLAISRRFEMGISCFRKPTDGFILNNNGWLLTEEKDQISSAIFIITCSLPEDNVVPENSSASYRLQIQNAVPKLKRISDRIWDCETYAEMQKIEGVYMNPLTGKLTYKLV